MTCKVTEPVTCSPLLAVLYWAQPIVLSGTAMPMGLPLRARWGCGAITARVWVLLSSVFSEIDYNFYYEAFESFLQKSCVLIPLLHCCCRRCSAGSSARFTVVYINKSLTFIFIKSSPKSDVDRGSVTETMEILKKYVIFILGSISKVR